MLGRLDTRAYIGWTLHTRADYRYMWSERDALIEPVLLFTQVTTDMSPIQLGDWTVAFHDHTSTTGAGIALCYVQIFIQGGFTVISSYNVFSPKERRLSVA